MRHASYHATGLFLAGSSLANRTSKRAGLFAALLGALHNSRRLQMQRVLRQHHHLIEPTRERGTSELAEASKLKLACDLNFGSRDHVGE
jgi:hypothetical protein